jgi:hypothetical protein
MNRVMRKSRRFIVVLAVLAAAILLPAAGLVRKLVIGGFQSVKGKATVAERVEEYGPAVHARLAGDFQRLGVAYPPKQVTLIGLKQERRLEVWVRSGDGPLKLLKSYPILAASGRMGPKLKEGDQQVPEGLYAIESLNPNSLFHLALRVSYPNQQDRDHAAAEGRTNLGGDIMIHGGSVSVGCLAMGDEAAEELFVLAAETGVEHIKVILCPMDLRICEPPLNLTGLPAWTKELYAVLQKELRQVGSGV